MLNLIFSVSFVLPFFFIERSENLSSQHAEKTSSAQSSAEPTRSSPAQQQMNAMTQKSSMDLQMSTALHGKTHLTLQQVQSLLTSAFTETAVGRWIMIKNICFLCECSVLEGCVIAGRFWL